MSNVCLNKKSVILFLSEIEFLEEQQKHFEEQQKYFEAEANHTRITIEQLKKKIKRSAEDEECNLHKTN